jgi:hypothetical protein
MNRGREATGGFSEALRGAARGRGQVNADLLGFQDFDEGAENRGFSRARATGEDGDFSRQRADDRRSLQIMERKPGFLLRPHDGSVGLDRRKTAPGAGEALDDVGNFPFMAIVVRKLEKIKLRVEC